MADVEIETFEVILGTSPSDGGATVVGPPYYTRGSAQVARDSLNQQRIAGYYDPATVSGKEFFVRTKSGTERLTVTTAVPGNPPTLDEVKTALQSSKASCVLYIKFINPTGDLRVAAIPSEIALSLLD